MADVSQDLVLGGQTAQYDLKASGSLNGVDAPLPAAVMFAPSGGVSLVTIDPLNVTVQASAVGPYSVVLSCGSLPPVTVSGTVTQFVAQADTLVATVSNLRP